MPSGAVSPSLGMVTGRTPVEPGITSVSLGLRFWRPLPRLRLFRPLPCIIGASVKALSFSAFTTKPGDPIRSLGFFTFCLHAWTPPQSFCDDDSDFFDVDHSLQSLHPGQFVDIVVSNLYLLVAHWRMSDSLDHGYPIRVFFVLFCY